MGSLNIVACPDKFRGTATAAQVATAIAHAASKVGLDEAGPATSDHAAFSVKQLPMADGGEGTLAALGGPNRTSTVTGPLGQPIEAAWRLDRANDAGRGNASRGNASAGRGSDQTTTAIIEMAQASGLELAGGADHNDPIAATTAGTGQLIAEAIKNQATRVIVSLGGSATTDGGAGAVEALKPHEQIRDVQLIAACDVQTRFVDAAQVFGPQKGATPAQVELLTRRLASLAAAYQRDYGVDVLPLTRAGAAGGLAGGLAVCGAELVGGFELVAQEVGLPEAIASADLVITGEGLLDAGSFDGKVVGGVIDLAAAAQVPVLVIVGRCEEAGMQAAASAAAPQSTAPQSTAPQVTVVSLSEIFGEQRALSHTGECIRQAVGDYLTGWPAA